MQTSRIIQGENMKKIILMLLLLLLVGCQDKADATLTVAVSIVPQETFVNKVAGDLIDVVVMIPPGNSPANYQPTPQMMAQFNESDIYFHIDVSAEVPILASVGNDVRLVDLAEIVDDKYPARYFEAYEEDHEEEHSHEGRDPHIWLSPKRSMVMVEVIRDELIALDPTHKETYESNAQSYLEELTVLDNELTLAFDQLESKAFIMYHPSFGYFAEDYNLDMYAIEVEGKDATIKELGHIIELAKEKNIKYVFYQEEFDSQQAEIVANEIGGETIKVAPLSGDYINNLRMILNKMQDILD